MRRTSTLLLALLLVASLAGQRISHAAPITSGQGPGGVGTLGTPSSGPLVWLNANTIAQTAGTKVNTWLDTSTNAKNATSHAGSVNTFQTNIRNTNPAVLLPGAVNQREFSVSNVNGRTFIAALSIAGNFNCCDGLFGEVGSDNGLRNNNGGLPQYEVTGAIGNAGVSVNGGPNTYGAFNTWHTMTALVNSPPTHTSLGIGQYFSTGDRELQGYLGEIVIYTQLINTAERQLINSYHGAKYNLTITNDRYQGDDLANGHYDFGVFGVGRIDNTNKLLNTGAAGMGIETTDATLGDGEFVMAGYKVESNNNTTTIEGLNGKRWARSWFVDKEDGASVNATLSFDFSDAGLGAPNGDEVLLYRSSEIGVWSILNANPVVSGDKFSFALNDAQLQNGYYTLGSLHIPEPSSLALLGFGIVGLVVKNRRRRNAA